MRNKGFTLIELLGVIVIIVIMSLLVLPQIVGTLKDSNVQLDAVTTEMIYNASSLYVSSRSDIYKPKNGTKYIIDLDDLIEDNLLTEINISGQDISSLKCVQVAYNNGFTYEIRNVGECEEVLVAAGLYDENENLIASWNSLVNDYGLDISKNYTSSNYNTSGIGSMYDVLTNNSELSDGAILVIGNGVTSIGDNALSYCTNLTSITIPSGVTRIGTGAFNGCSSLESVTLPSGITEIGMNLFYGCSSLKSITIPSSVTYIAQSAFQNCSSLESITIPSGVSSIEMYAFYGCSSLKSIMIPSGVRRVGTYAFYGCDDLTSVVFGNNSELMSLGNSAFNGCSSLESITIPNGVTSIGNDTFLGCSSLASIILSNNITSIGMQAFYGCSSLESVTLPSGVTSIGQSAFMNCSSLTSVVIPSGVTSISIQAFYGCSSLESVTLPSGVTSIGRVAFGNCSSLASITIPSSVTSIGSGAFQQCSNLTSVIFEEPSGWWYASSSNATSGTEISSSDLANAATAATYLKTTYKNYYWQRTEPSLPSTIVFTLNVGGGMNPMYTAVSNMTWREWVNSAYNTDGYTIQDDYVLTSSGKIVLFDNISSQLHVICGNSKVSPDDVILARTYYTNGQCVVNPSS